MPNLPKSKTAPNAQRQRFEEAARELECDDDKDRFEKRLGKIAKVRPAPKRGTKK